MNRGQALENMIDAANRYYRAKDLAYIWKVPTPVKVLRNYKGRIRDGFFEKGEYVDYVGITKDGRSIAFDAKSTIEDRFDIMKNLKPHQYRFLETYHRMGATSFLVVGFMHRQKYFIMPFEMIQDHYRAVELGKKKGISWKEFAISCRSVRLSSMIGLDYLRW